MTQTILSIKVYGQSIHLFCRTLWGVQMPLPSTYEPSHAHLIAKVGSLGGLEKHSLGSFWVKILKTCLLQQIDIV